MGTLYLRNVPDEVGERLADLAAREGISISALAVRELARVARRADNVALLDALPHHGLGVRTVVTGLEADRDAR